MAVILSQVRWKTRAKRFLVHGGRPFRPWKGRQWGLL